MCEHGVPRRTTVHVEQATTQKFAEIHTHVEHVNNPAHRAVVIDRQRARLEPREYFPFEWQGRTEFYAFKMGNTHAALGRSRLTLAKGSTMGVI